MWRLQFFPRNPDANSAVDCNLHVVTELAQICHQASNIVEYAIHQHAMEHYPPVVLASAQISSQLPQTVELVEPIVPEFNLPAALELFHVLESLQHVALGHVLTSIPIPPIAATAVPFVDQPPQPVALGTVRILPPTQIIAAAAMPFHASESSPPAAVATAWTWRAISPAVEPALHRHAEAGTQPAAAEIARILARILTTVVTVSHSHVGVRCLRAVIGHAPISARISIIAELAPLLHARVPCLPAVMEYVRTWLLVRVVADSAINRVLLARVVAPVLMGYISPAQLPRPSVPQQDYVVPLRRLVSRAVHFPVVVSH
ncbi:hypothetical protein N7490_000414 [Penicillium lividum]|nr:hypothetical protein N7490_000414 [Penicillium lividum]